MDIGDKIIELPSERMAQLQRALDEERDHSARLARLHLEEQRARQNYEAICKNYEAAQSRLVTEMGHLIFHEDSVSSTTLKWWRHILDHAEDALTPCRECFEGGETCDVCMEKERERMVENWEPTDREIYGQ